MIEGETIDDGPWHGWMRKAFWFLLLTRIFALGYILLSHQDQVDAGLAGDVRRYIEMSTAHGLPYRDFQIEYPPITYVLIRLLTGPDVARSIALIAISQFLCDVGTAAALRWSWGRRTMLAYLAFGFPLICFPFIYGRIDLFATALTVASLALIRRGRDVGGGAVLGLAVLAKIWPFCVAPVLLVERKVRGVVALGVSVSAIAGLWLFVGGTAGPQQVVSFRDATGWQVESLVGVVWHMRDQSKVKFESGAWRTGVMPLWARPLLTVLSLAFILLAWWWAKRRRRSGADDRVVYGLAPLASVVALLIFAPILSTQYVVWMLPFGAIIAARGDRLVGWLTAAIAAASALSYPLVAAAAHDNLWASTPVLARNLLLVALFVTAFIRLRGAPDSAVDAGGGRSELQPASDRSVRASVSA